MIRVVWGTGPNSQYRYPTRRLAPDGMKRVGMQNLWNITINDKTKSEDDHAPLGSDETVIKKDQNNMNYCLVAGPDGNLGLVITRGSMESWLWWKLGQVAS